ncbi:MAG: tetratricopeptide repeat protein [Isosphaeraceae bacterium]
MKSRRTLLALAAVGALAGGLAWWWVGPRKVQALAESARQAVRERRFDQAEVAVDRWIALRPQDGEPHYWKARVLLARDLPQPTLDAITAAAQRGYDRKPLEAIRGVMLARAGKFPEAEPLLRRAAAENLGPEPEISEGLARVYLGTFQLAKAATALDRWMEAAPEDARPHLWRNEIEERNSAEASVLIRNYRLALQRDPNLDEARLKLAHTLRDAQRNAEAEAEYERYLERNPRSVPALVGAGQTALQSGDLVTATRRYDEALAIDPREPVALRELALIDLRSGRFDRARERLATVVEIDAFNPEVRSSYARALKMVGEDARAAEQTAIVERLRREHVRIAELREALVSNPNDLELKSETARWLLEHGHEQEGLEWTELILRERPGHRPTCQALAEYHQKRGNVGLANYYRTAAGGGPGG